MSAPHIHTMNDEALLECPFCGSGDCYPDTDITNKRHFIWCGSCGCGTGDRLNRASAIRKWNTRNGHLYTKADFAEKSWEMQNSDLTGGA